MEFLGRSAQEEVPYDEAHVACAQEEVLYVEAVIDCTKEEVLYIEADIDCTNEEHFDCAQEKVFMMKLQLTQLQMKSVLSGLLQLEGSSSYD